MDNAHNELLALDLSTPQLHLAWGKSTNTTITSIASTHTLKENSKNTDYSLDTHVPQKPHAIHSEILMTKLKHLQTHIQGDFENLYCVIVTLGPGSFTGLRIALSFAKGLQAGNGCTLIGMNTTDMWANIHHAPRPLLVLLDARSNKFYCKLYMSADSTSEIYDISTKEILTLLSQHSLPQTVYVGGPAAHYFLDSLPPPYSESENTPYSFIMQDTAHIDVAANMLHMGLEYYTNKQNILDIHATPVYVRHAI